MFASTQVQKYSVIVPFGELESDAKLKKNLIHNIR